MNWKTYLQGRTRDPRFLWRTVLAILAVGGAASVGVHFLLEPPGLHSPAVAITELSDPDTPESDKPGVWRLQTAIEEHDWSQVWWLIPVVSWVEVEAGPAVIAGLAGLFWFVFLLQAGQALSLREVRFWLCAAAFVLGALSTWPTLFAVVWQEEVWAFDWDSQAGLGPGLKYFILGVGLREELIKLLFVLPLVPWLVARRDELERLIVSACVGLGFAAEENINYLSSSFSTVSVGRYLTANAFHLTATGLAGLWLCRAIRWPKECGVQFLAYFGLIVVAHGAYDAFLAVPELADYSMVGTIVFIVLVYVFFHELRELRPARREAISLTANFVVGLSLLAAITFVYVTAQVGLPDASRIFAQPAIAISLMAYVFLREVPESLVRT